MKAKMLRNLNSTHTHPLINPDMRLGGGSKRQKACKEMRGGKESEVLTGAEGGKKPLLCFQQAACVCVRVRGMCVSLHDAWQTLQDFTRDKHTVPTHSNPHKSGKTTSAPAFSMYQLQRTHMCVYWNSSGCFFY